MCVCYKPEHNYSPAPWFGSGAAVLAVMVGRMNIPVCNLTTVSVGQESCSTGLAAGQKACGEMVDWTFKDKRRACHGLKISKYEELATLNADIHCWATKIPRELRTK